MHLEEDTGVVEIKNDSIVLPPVVVELPVVEYIHDRYLSERQLNELYALLSKSGQFHWQNSEYLPQFVFVEVMVRLASLDFALPPTWRQQGHPFYKKVCFLIFVYILSIERCLNPL